jgi:hypothetical protein
VGHWLLVTAYRESKRRVEITTNFQDGVLREVSEHLSVMISLVTTNEAIQQIWTTNTAVGLRSSVSVMLRRESDIREFESYRT